ncbi:hypothetical protein F2Q68_00014619 [Brassica cretica]|uniref:Uncharacterized protein n=1 Tax=Brassica cretica TaxID=69181 RepID=A0A8S9HKI7_BRACR|nr:hypothetical protein F2Q68_00014619 [Brassica cretica]
MERSEIRVSSAGSLSHFHALHSFHQWPIHVTFSRRLPHRNRIFSLCPPQLLKVFSVSWGLMSTYASRFLAQTGLVPVETQMQELNLAPTTDKSN